MKTFLLFISIALTLAGCQSIGGKADSKTNTSNNIKILIIDGFNNHDWLATTQAILSILKKDKNMIAEVSTIPMTDLAVWEEWLPRFEDYDVIIQNTNNIGNDNSWPDGAKIAFEEYMRKGGGMLVFHSANNAFSEWVEYNNMIGLGWRDKDFGSSIVIENNKPVIIPKGQGGNTRHGRRVTTLVTSLGEHPIHNGLPRQWMTADLEIYRHARGPVENINILSYARDNLTNTNFPIEWTVNYGQGRVYNSTYGHYWNDLPEAPAGIRDVAFQTIFLRAITWLAGNEVQATVPDNFPTKNRISLENLLN